MIVLVNLLIIIIFCYMRLKVYKNEVNLNFKKKRKCKFFYSFIYIVYMLVFLIFLIGVVFIMFYSMIWGKEKFNKWIILVIVLLV